MAGTAQKEGAFTKVLFLKGVLSIMLVLSDIANCIPNPQGGGDRDTCNVDADCQKGGQTNRCCSQFYFCGTGPDYCAEGS